MKTHRGSGGWAPFNLYNGTRWVKSVSRSGRINPATFSQAWAAALLSFPRHRPKWRMTEQWPTYTVQHLAHTHVKQHREATTSQGTKRHISDTAVNTIYSSHDAQSPQLTPAHALSLQPACGQGQMPQFCPASLRPDATLPFQHTGSLFYLTTIVCQFSPKLRSACGRQVTLIRETSRKEVNNSCQIKYWPCILLIGSWFNNQSQTFVA